MQVMVNYLHCICLKLGGIREPTLEYDTKVNAGSLIVHKLRSIYPIVLVFSWYGSNEFSHSFRDIEFIKCIIVYLW